MSGFRCEITCSSAASGVTGLTMITDGGYISSAITESFPAATPVINYLYSGV